MAVRLNPYLGFENSAREAMEFYQSVMGGELTISTFGEAKAEVQPDELDLVMHAMLTTENGIVLMASDAPAHIEHETGSSISVSLSGEAEDDEVLSGYFDGLSAGGKVTVPLAAAPWGDKFGMFKDKFGTNWMVNIAGAKSE